MAKTICYAPRIWGRPPRQLTPSLRKALLAKRDAWLQQIDPASLFHPLFDLLPDVYFFAKNRRGELMFLSRKSLELYHLTNAEQLIGLTDFDLNPTPMAQAYVQDDERIYATGQSLLHRVELWFDRLGMPEWFLVYKLPIRSRGGKIIGIMGFSQSYEGRAKLLSPLGSIARAVAFIRENYQHEVTLAQLARVACVSPRHLERKFKTVFGVRPHEFLIKTRVLAACRRLPGTNDSLADVAATCGFSDQSAFTHHFHQQVGVTPTAFRRNSGAE